jgi:hypothetical protein
MWCALVDSCRRAGLEVFLLAVLCSMSAPGTALGKSQGE